MAHSWTPRFKESPRHWPALKSEFTLGKWPPRLGSDKESPLSLRRDRTDRLKPTRLIKTRIAIDDLVHSSSPPPSPADGLESISPFGLSLPLPLSPFHTLALASSTSWNDHQLSVKNPFRGCQSSSWKARSTRITEALSQSPIFHHNTILSPPFLFNPDLNLKPHWSTTQPRLHLSISLI